MATYTVPGTHPADLNLHYTDLLLPSRAHKMSIEQSTRKICKNALLSLLNTQCMGEFTPHQLSLSRLWCIHICSACCTHCPFALACVRILVHTCITVFCLSFAMDKKSFLFVFGKISHKPYLVCLRLLTQHGAVNVLLYL